MDLDQVFEYAIDQEIKAMEFYESSASQTDNAEAASLFRSLARMEAAHQRALTHEREVLKDLGHRDEKKYEQKTPEAEMIESLNKMAQVLKEANVELTTRHGKIKAELAAAEKIQESLLPRKAPQLPGLAISVSCSMAAEVGGDYYDFMVGPRGHLAMTIADVSGKGMPAALLMIAMRTLWRAKIREDNAPDEVLNAISEDALAELEASEQFVTMISASYNPENSGLTFANAGHWPPLVLHMKATDFEPINAGFLPLGLGGSRYVAHTIELAPGSVVVFFSDGVIDAMNSTRERFGEDRLQRIVLESHKLSGDEIRDAILTALFEFSPGEQADDQTMVVIKKSEHLKDASP